MTLMFMATMRPCLLRCGARASAQRRLAPRVRAAHSETYTTPAPQGPAVPQAPPVDAPSVNMVTLVGTVTRRPWFNDYGNFQKATFSVDVKRGRTTKPSRNEIKVTAWNELASWVTVNIDQHHVVSLTGELLNNNWQDKATQEWRSEVTVVADQIQHYQAGMPLLQPLVLDPASAPQHAEPAAYGQQPAPSFAAAPAPAGGPAAPATRPLVQSLKTNRTFPKMAAVHTAVVNNYFGFPDVAASFGIQPYTAINYAVTHWEVNNAPLDLGMISIMLDIGLDGEGCMELRALMDVVANTYRAAAVDCAMHSVSVSYVREQLLSSGLAAAVEAQERSRGGASVTYTQATFAESLYRRGMAVEDVEAAIQGARGVMQLQAPAMH